MSAFLNDEGSHVAIATLLERLSHFEPWETLVWHKDPEGKRNGRTTTVSDVREALLGAVDIEYREGLVKDFGSATERARPKEFERRIDGPYSR